MIKMFKVEPTEADPGPRNVFIITSDRDEMRSAMNQLVARPGEARIIYYDRPGRGGVELLLETQLRHGQLVATLQIGRYSGWGEPCEMSCAAAREEVGLAFNSRPEPPSKGTGSVESHHEPDGAPPRAASAVAPITATRPVRGQMVLL